MQRQIRHFRLVVGGRRRRHCSPDSWPVTNRTDSLPHNAAQDQARTGVPIGAAGIGAASSGKGSSIPSPSRPAYSPSQTPNYSPSPAKAAAPMHSPPISPAAAASDHAMTIDLGQTIAIPPSGDTSDVSLGSIKFVSGALAGKQFDLTTEGACIGRDSNCRRS